jgi:c(7)-type cytochrome triheme protein
MAEMEKGKSCGACHDGKSAFSVAGSCGKCHPVKDAVLALDARFSHTKHLEMYKCYDCHSKLFNASVNNKRRSMAEMEKGASCGACHDGSTGFSVKGDCDKCHRSTVEVDIKVPSAGNTLFSHKFHTGMYKCVDCHNSIFTTGKSAVRYKMADMEKGKSCGACHDGKTAFAVKDSCGKCHPVKEIPFKESGARFSHQLHLAAYSCTDCHDSIFLPGPNNRRHTMPDMEKGQSCGSCHDGKTAFSVTGDCGKCHNVTKAIKYEFTGKATGPVLFSHKVHSGRGYTCADCHYKVFTTGVARRSFTMKDMQGGKSCGACHGMSMAFDVKDPNNCARCHVSAAQDLFNWTPPD